MTEFSLPTFADAETPIALGAEQLVLQNAPNPPVCLQLFRNGQLMTNPDDYLLAGQTVRLLSPSAEGDKFLAFYRY